MYRSNGTSSTMATLLQQNNCMKPLNGASPAATNPSGIANQNSNSADGSDMKPGATGASSRPLLPHEMVGLQQTSSMLLPHQQHHHFNSHHNQHNQFSQNSFSNYFSQQQNQNQHHHHSTTSQHNNSHHHHHHLPHHQHHHHHQSGGQHLLPHQQLSGSSAPQSNTSHFLPHQLGRLAGTVTSTASAAASKPDSSGDQKHHQNILPDHSNSANGDRLSPNSCHSSHNTQGSLSQEALAQIQQEQEAAAAAQAAEDAEPEPEIDIVINNVVCSFSVRCHLNLREIALNGVNVEFRRENGMVTMKLRRPYTTASIWSSGRITCTGATSEDQAKVAARRYARCLQKLGFNVRFRHFRVVNVLGTCSMPWAIKIVNFSEKYKKDASYEPELHPGVTYKLKWPKATLKIFSTGSITVTANSVENVQKAIEHIFPLVYEFRKKRAPDDPKLLKQQAAQAAAAEAAALKAAAAEAAAEAAAAANPDAKPASPSANTASKPSAISSETAAAASIHQSNKLKRKRPFGVSSNDPAEDNMYVSDVDEDADDLDDDVDDLIEEDFGTDDDDDDM